ncbi:hypothetical protein AVEN_24738-1 [Araneus ventricosus]|uniref:Uncharacterized protein n=1 Tax=Araneus ventricosus TaxID=182803 RepID=A0A4Y2L028_ARAVE|nr:hypothetical protein AVEN_24738-1 [Araneus ventricosus]
MEFLEHGKEKAIVSFKNRWKLAQRLGEAGIPTNSKPSISCADSNLGPRAIKSKGLPYWHLDSRLDHVESKIGKPPWWGGEMRWYRNLEPHVNDVPDFFNSKWVGKKASPGQMEWSTDELPALRTHDQTRRSIFSEFGMNVP